jgi:hypothetical protein
MAKNPSSQRLPGGALEESTPLGKTADSEGAESLEKTRIAEVRNAKRWHEMDTADEKLLGKSTDQYLSQDPRMYTPATVWGPDDSFQPPEWFLPMLKVIAEAPVETPLKPDVMFEMSDEARKYNHDRLAEHNFDMSMLIQANQGTTLDYGSEFRPMYQLEPLLGAHPNFEAIKGFIEEGMPYIFKKEVDEETRLLEFEAAIERGNHKSAQKEPDRLLELISKDVKHGFSLPISTETARKLKGATAQPLGLVHQWSLNPDGSRVEKSRMTQDLSFSPLNPANAINARIDMAAYPEMVYGWCLPRIFHFMVALRYHHPNKRIFISKYDYSDAYRRMAHEAKAAAQTISAIGDAAFIALRLTFGGSPNPPTWCAVSELVADLANEISQCKEWDPEVLFNPAQSETPEPEMMPDEIPIGLAYEMSVMPPPIVEGKVDVFIDDLINVFLDTPENRRRQPHVVPLAAHLTNRPHSGDGVEPVPRRPIINIPKLQAEGTPAEIQVVLGWSLDTRRLLVALPDDKQIAWAGDIRNFLKARRMTRAELESLLGRLNHAAAIMPLARHFLGRLRGLLASKQEGYKSLNIRAEVAADLRLWLELLETANRGLSLNCLVTRVPTSVCFSDSCPYGIAGYSISGRGWRIRIPKTSIVYGNRRINNFLEFLGMAINVFLETMSNDEDFPCILALGDNTSAIGWLHNTSKLHSDEPCHAAHLFVARLLAAHLMSKGACLASQHIRGKLNIVADIMSYTTERRDGGKQNPIAWDDPTNDELTQRFHLLYPKQVPENFSISQLPPSILSWVTRALQIAESSLIRNKKRVMKTETEHGDAGWDSAPKQESTVTPSSLNYTQKKEHSSAKPFLPASDPQHGQQQVNLMAQVRSQYSQGLSAKPQATWLRRFGAITNQAPCTARAVPTTIP